ncbi:hypothetical protein ABZS79_04970 [Streptomyces griseoloalbus]|uniref:hypothetical protein n=1 Tax=Streptomyces griseoloalbus TaxID=67303 RepID=UPI0033B99BE2
MTPEDLLALLVTHRQSLAADLHDEEDREEVAAALRELREAVTADRSAAPAMRRLRRALSALPPGHPVSDALASRRYAADGTGGRALPTADAVGTVLNLLEPPAAPAVPGAPAVPDAGPSPESGAGPSPGSGESRALDPGEPRAPEAGELPVPDPGELPVPDPGQLRAPGPGDSRAPGPGDSRAPEAGELPVPDPRQSRAPDPGEPPAPDPRELLAQARERLLSAPALTEREHAALLSSHGDQPGLIRLADPRPGSSTARCPRFQFRPGTLQPLPVVLRINGLLRADLDPWGAADWWLGANSWLHGVPADLLGTLPDEELEGAALELVEAD